VTSTARSAFAASFLVLLFSTKILLAQPLYHLTDLGKIGGMGVATGINESGHIVGYSGTAARHALEYSNGTMTDEILQ